MQVKGVMSTEVKNALLTIKGNNLVKCFATNASTILRSSIEDVSWGTASLGKLNLNPAVNDGRVNLVIDENSVGSNGIKFIELSSLDIDAPDVRLLRIELPQAEEFPNGGLLIVTKIEHVLSDKALV